MKEIQLTKGKAAIVDDDDYERLSQYNWHYVDAGYACRYDKTSKSKRQWMHHAILPVPFDHRIDHINHNKLDNRKENLRPCTMQQNSWNSRPQKDQMYSPYKGVTYSKQLKKWKASITIKGKTCFLGYFAKELHAAIAYATAARLLHGKFAYSLSLDPLSQTE